MTTPKKLPAQLPTFLTLFAFTLLFTGCNTVTDDQPGQPVMHRQQAFKEILKVFEPMGTMLRTNNYQAEKFLALANELKARRDAPWAHFGPHTNYPPTKAAAAIWQRPGEFEQDRQAFLAATDELVSVAQHKDAATIEPVYKKLYDTCRTCHKTFRAG